eukprot:jgi/Galph1/4424/GphlegSOOS_G3106.1
MRRAGLSRRGRGGDRTVNKPRVTDARKQGRPPSKIQLFYRSIFEEDTRKLREILQTEGFSAIKPFNDAGIPPLHFAVLHRKLKSLKCLVEHIDRVQSQQEIDFLDDEHLQTPLMVAAEIGWVEGAKVLLDNGADITAKDEEGHTARDYGVLSESKQILEFFDKWKKEHDVAEEVVEEDEVVFETPTQRSRRKRRDLERQERSGMELVSTDRTPSQKGDTESEKADSVGIALNDLDKREKLSSLAQWDELKVAINELRRDLTVDRVKERNQTETYPDSVIDPALWNYNVLQRLQLRLPSGSMDSLPAELSNLVNLSSLIINDNSFKHLPNSIGSLRSLRVLEIENNELEDLPESLSSCTKLEAVRLTGNKLRSLKPLQGAVDLVSLYCDRNQLEALDLDFSRMNRLSILSTTYNKIREIPDSIGHLENLTVLQLSGNLLEELPSSLGDLKKLQTLTLDDNPIRDQKILKILTKGKKPMKEFLQYMKKRKGRNKKSKTEQHEQSDEESE